MALLTEEMELKVQIDGIDYEIRTTPKAWPLLALIDDLRINASKDVDDALKKGEVLEIALERLMDLCVSPKPPKNLWLKFFILINAIDADAIKEAKEIYDRFRRLDNQE